MRQWIPDQVYENAAKAEDVIKFLRSQYSNKPDPRNAPYVLGIELRKSWAINKLGLPCVLGIVASDNKNSCRVLEKSGYIFVEEKEKNAFGRHGLCKIYRVAP